MVAKSDSIMNELLKKIKRLSDEEKLQLIRGISGIIAVKKSKLKWMELAGTGRDVWKGIDAQEYVERERRGWVGPSS